MSTATSFEPQPTPGVVPPPPSPDAFQTTQQPGIEPYPILSTAPTATGENGLATPDPALVSPIVEATTTPPATQTGPNLDALLQPSPDSKTPITDLAVRADQLMKSLTDPELKEAVVRTFERGAAQMLGVSPSPIEPENNPH